MDIIALKNISFAFANRIPFFNQMHINFVAHSLNFITGKNGSGKTTLFNLMQGKIGADESVSGEICINNETFKITSDSNLNYLLSKHIRAVAQNYKIMLADNLTFKENLQCASLGKYPNLQRLPSNVIIPDCIKNIAIPLNKPVQLLSGGQQQILAILMVLQKTPTILLLDEPTAALDSANATMVMQFLQKIAKTMNITIIIISHDIELIKQYASGMHVISINENNNTRAIESKHFKE